MSLRFYLLCLSRQIPLLATSRIDVPRRPYPRESQAWCIWYTCCTWNGQNRWSRREALETRAFWQDLNQAQTQLSIDSKLWSMKLELRCALSDSASSRQSGESYLAILVVTFLWSIGGQLPCRRWQMSKCQSIARNRIVVSKCSRQIIPRHFRLGMGTWDDGQTSLHLGGGQAT